jgi:hypothetical protein
MSAGPPVTEFFIVFAHPMAIGRVRKITTVQNGIWPRSEMIPTQTYGKIISKP